MLLPKNECILFSDLEKDENGAISVKNVSGATLKIVFEFCNIFVDAPPYKPLNAFKPLELRYNAAVIRFMDQLSNQQFKDILRAALYLDNVRLMDSGLLRLHRSLEGRVSYRLSSTFTNF